jgi:hypothetical protein
MWKTNGHVDSICRRRRKSAKPGAVTAPCSQQEVAHLLHRSETNRTVPLDKTRLWESNVLGMTERAHCGGNVRSAKANLRLFSATFLPNFNACPAHTTMASPVPSMSALRVLRQSIQPQVQQTTQVRHATLLRRPKRPYTFTQLITLSDGSSFTLRTTNPQPVYKSAKDIRNSPLWNPSSQKLLNVEEDEAGRLASFRIKFGRAWDAETDAEKVGGRGRAQQAISRLVSC